MPTNVIVAGDHVVELCGGEIRVYDDELRLWQCFGGAEGATAFTAARVACLCRNRNTIHVHSTRATRVPGIDALLAGRGPIDVSALLSAAGTATSNAPSTNKPHSDAPVVPVLLVAAATADRVTLHVAPLTGHERTSNIVLALPEARGAPPPFHVDIVPLLESSLAAGSDGWEEGAVAVLVAFRTVPPLSHDASVAAGATDLGASTAPHISSLRVDAWVLRLRGQGQLGVRGSRTGPGCTEGQGGAAPTEEDALLQTGDYHDVDNGNVGSLLSPLAHLHNVAGVGVGSNVAAADCTDTAATTKGCAQPVALIQPMVKVVSDRGASVAAGQSQALTAANNAAQRSAPLVAVSAESLSATLLLPLPAAGVTGPLRVLSTARFVTNSASASPVRPEVTLVSLVAHGVGAVATVLHTHAFLAAGDSASPPAARDGPQKREPAVLCVRVDGAWQPLSLPRGCSGVTAAVACCAPAELGPDTNEGGGSKERTGGLDSLRFLLLSEDAATEAPADLAHAAYACSEAPPSQPLVLSSTAFKPVHAALPVRPVFVSRGLNMALEDGSAGRLWGRQRHADAVSGSRDATGGSLVESALLASLLPQGAEQLRQRESLGQAHSDADNAPSGVFLIAPVSNAPDLVADRRVGLLPPQGQQQQQPEPAALRHPLLLPSRALDARAALAFAALPDLLVVKKEPPPPPPPQQQQQQHPVRDAARRIVSTATSSRWALRELRVSVAAAEVAGICRCTLSATCAESPGLQLPPPQSPSVSSKGCALAWLSPAGPWGLPKRRGGFAAVVYRHIEGDDTSTGAQRQHSNLRVAFFSTGPPHQWLGDCALVHSLPHPASTVSFSSSAAAEVAHFNPAVLSAADVIAACLAESEGAGGTESGASRLLDLRVVLLGRGDCGNSPACHGSTTVTPLPPAPAVLVASLRVAVAGRAAIVVISRVLRALTLPWQPSQVVPGTASGLQDDRQRQSVLPVLSSAIALPARPSETEPEASTAALSTASSVVAARNHVERPGAASSLRAEALAAAACAQATAALALAESAAGAAREAASEGGAEPSTDVAGWAAAVRDARAALRAAESVVRRLAS